MIEVSVNSAQQNTKLSHLLAEEYRLKKITSVSLSDVTKKNAQDLPTRSDLVTVY